MRLIPIAAALGLAALCVPAWAALGDAPEAADLSAAPSDGAALGLDQALQEGLERSPSYRASEATASEKEWGRLEAFSAFLPSVSLDGTRFLQDKYQVLPVSFGPLVGAFPEVNPYAQYGFSARWTLFDGWAGVNTLRAADSASAAAEADRDWAEFQLRQDIRLKFYRALAAVKLVSLADENVKTLKDHLRIVKDLLSNGRATRFDLLRVEVQLDDARTGQLDAQDKVDMARRSLSLAMGEANDHRPLAGALPQPGEAPPETVPIDDKPDVRSKLLEADAAQQASLAAAGQWAPKLSVIGDYQWYYNGYNGANEMDPGDTAAHGTNYDLGLEASWELFNGGGSLARQREASRKADEAGAAAEQARLQASYDRAYWKRRLAYSAQLYQAKLAEVDKAAESVRLADLGLKAGTRTTTEVLDAELDSFSAAAAVVSAQMDAAEALINLESALGTGDQP
ncbi:MAG TPA: TolC family protein [bacterium]|jgi:outer membrane protein TolC|nr:TolC family protein [bacterium]